MTLLARVLSPAKVNLHLEIYPLREDGFHSLLSIFQMVSLYDEIRVCSLTDDDVCTITGNFDFPAEDNIIGKCCRIFREQTGIRTGLSFDVRKRIPAGAGLGGGSSNGASVLRALNAMFQTGLSPVDLAAMGAKAGSDIPFFCSAPAALVSGRGEFIEPLAARTDYFLVLVVPPIHVGTAAAYGWLDKAQMTAVPSADRAGYIRALYERENPAGWDFFNSFYPVLMEKEPVFGDITRRLRDAGALYASVSGSGSALFGVFQSEIDAKKTEKLLKKTYSCTEFLSPLAGMPEVVLH